MIKWAKRSTFVDLFAGLGGFHVGLARLGHECVFASEIDPHLQAIYEKNFGIRPAGDIRRVGINEIPPHDLLCAGFPCQPYSKAGSQRGADCPKWGDLFEYVLRIIKARRPRFIILENVPNLGKHKDGATWTAMRSELERLDLDVDERVLSPHQFGIPQIRERMYIVGGRSREGGIGHFSWPVPDRKDTPDVRTVLDKRPSEARPLSNQVRRCLEVWQEFLDRSPRSVELPSFPIWTMEFGATYPIEGPTPFSLGPRRIMKYRGSHGVPLREFAPDERFLMLPSHARQWGSEFPRWKIQFIRQNREFYARNRKWIDPWLPKILEFPASLQKFEWNCKGEERDIWKYVVQIRASGVRVKRPTTAPSLIAMTTTQVPIIAWEKRYMTPRECSRLQSLEGLQHLPEVPTRAYKALGNAVNSRIVSLIAGSLCQLESSLDDSHRFESEPSRNLQPNNWSQRGLQVHIYRVG